MPADTHGPSENAIRSRAPSRRRTRLQRAPTRCPCSACERERRLRLRRRETTDRRASSWDRDRETRRQRLDGCPLRRAASVSRATARCHATVSGPPSDSARAPTAPARVHEHPARVAAVDADAENHACSISPSPIGVHVATCVRATACGRLRARSLSAVRPLALVSGIAAATAKQHAIDLFEETFELRFVAARSARARRRLPREGT